VSRPAAASLIVLVVASATALSCSSSEQEAGPTSPEHEAGLAYPEQAPASGPALRIYNDPYRGVDWEGDLRLLTQMHDHVGNDTLKIKAYDEAGYDVLSLLDYSGVVADDTRRERIWPPERVLPGGYLSRLTSIELLLPSGEESGFDHVTSPFLEAYIEKWDTRYLTTREPHHYYSTQEAIELINGLGGMALLAHPWLVRPYAALGGLAGIEIYNAYGAFQQRAGNLHQIGGHPQVDRALVALWDELLAIDPTVLGIAVNDHFGPYSRAVATGDPLKDSGKIVVFAKEASLEAFRAAFERGAFVAVRDVGVRKGEYPVVRSILATDVGIEIDADGEIAWIANGARVGTGARVALSSLTSGYVRAQIAGADGSIVYTQVFSLRPIGDTDGDGYVDGADEELCAGIELGGESSENALIACLELGWASP
jgi:hypothetical protein